MQFAAFRDVRIKAKVNAECAGARTENIEKRKTANPIKSIPAHLDRPVPMYGNRFIPAFRLSHDRAVRLGVVLLKQVNRSLRKDNPPAKCVIRSIAFAD